MIRPTCSTGPFEIHYPMNRTKIPAMSCQAASGSFVTLQLKSIFPHVLCSRPKLNNPNFLHPESSFIIKAIHLDGSFTLTAFPTPIYLPSCPLHTIPSPGWFPLIFDLIYDQYTPYSDLVPASSSSSSPHHCLVPFQLQVLPWPFTSNFSVQAPLL